MSKVIEGFVVITPEGKFVYKWNRQTSVGSEAAYDVTDNLAQASVFTSPLNEAEKAKFPGYVVVPAYSVRIVRLGQPVNGVAPCL